MPKYAIAFINFFDNENKVYIVEAENQIKALRKIVPHINKDTIEDIKQGVFDCDQSISTPIQVPDSTNLIEP
jgi:hypothetical protein